MARAPALQEIEVHPEADRLEGFAHPRETAQLFGQANAERSLTEAFAGGRMHHAWLLVGREGIGKATLAYRFARHAFARTGERDPLGASLAVPDDCPAARQVRALSHPGLLVIRRPYDPKTKRFAASIPVDEVRRLRGFLMHSSGAEAWRVVIVDQADELNINAANALLKSLEEPPARTVFLLVCSQPGRLLPTIRSRCRLLPLEPLSREDIALAAKAAIAGAEAAGEIAEDAWPDLVRAAKGSVRSLLVLAGTGGIDLTRKVDALLSSLPSLDWQAAHALSDALGPPAAEQQFEMFYELLLTRLAALVRASATGDGDPGDKALAERLVASKDAASWAELWEAAHAAKSEAMALNLDRKALLLDLFARLAAAARR